MKVLNVSVNISNLPSKEDLVNIIKSDDRNKKVTVSEINKAIKDSGLYKPNTKSEPREEQDSANDRNDNTI